MRPHSAHNHMQAKPARQQRSRRFNNQSITAAYQAFNQQQQRSQVPNTLTQSVPATGHHIFNNAVSPIQYADQITHQMQNGQPILYTHQQSTPNLNQYNHYIDPSNTSYKNHANTTTTAASYYFPKAQPAHLPSNLNQIPAAVQDDLSPVFYQSYVGNHFPHKHQNFDILDQRQQPIAHIESNYDYHENESRSAQNDMIYPRHSDEHSLTVSANEHKSQQIDNSETPAGEGLTTHRSTCQEPRIASLSSRKVVQEPSRSRSRPVSAVINKAKLRPQTAHQMKATIQPATTSIVVKNKDRHEFNANTAKMDQGVLFSQVDDRTRYIPNKIKVAANLLPAKAPSRINTDTIKYRAAIEMSIPFNKVLDYTNEMAEKEERRRRKLQRHELRKAKREQERLQAELKHKQLVIKQRELEEFEEEQRKQQIEIEAKQLMMNWQKQKDKQNEKLVFLEKFKHKLKKTNNQNAQFYRQNSRSIFRNQTARWDDLKVESNNWKQQVLDRMETNRNRLNQVEQLQSSFMQNTMMRNENARQSTTAQRASLVDTQTKVNNMFHQKRRQSVDFVNEKMHQLIQDMKQQTQQQEAVAAAAQQPSARTPNNQTRVRSSKHSSKHQLSSHSQHQHHQQSDIDHQTDEEYETNTDYDELKDMIDMPATFAPTSAATIVTHPMGHNRNTSQHQNLLVEGYLTDRHLLDDQDVGQMLEQIDSLEI